MNLKSLIIFSGLFACFYSCMPEDDAYEKYKQAQESEKANIEAYVAKMGYTAAPDEYGLYVIAEDSGSGHRIVNGDFIKISYDLFKLVGTNEQLLESTDSVRATTAGLSRIVVFGPTKFKVGNSNILGVNGGLLGMGEGAAGRLIIPSWLAFDNTEGIKDIPPFTTLVFDFFVDEYIPDPYRYDSLELSAYLSTNNFSEADKLEEGVYRKVHIAGSGDVPDMYKDKLVLLNTLKLIDGRVVYTTREYSADTVILNDSRIIPGFLLAASKMKKGEKSTLVIAYNKAFGVNGNADLRIPVITSVVYEMEVVNIIRPTSIKQGEVGITGGKMVQASQGLPATLIFNNSSLVK